MRNVFSFSSIVCQASAVLYKQSSSIRLVHYIGIPNQIISAFQMLFPQYVYDFFWLLKFAYNTLCYLFNNISFSEPDDFMDRSVDTIFVQGALSSRRGYEPFPVFEEMLWSASLGPASSVEDRACELLYGILKKNTVIYVDKSNHNKTKKTYQKRSLPIAALEYLIKTFKGDPTTPSAPPCYKKGLNVIASSYGATTIVQLLIYLYQHHIAVLRNRGKKGVSLTNEEITILKNAELSGETGGLAELDESDALQYKFVDEYGEPLDVSPYMFKKIAFVSPVLGGISWIKEGLRLDDKLKYATWSPAWILAIVTMLWYKLVGDTIGYIVSPYLGQYNDKELEFVEDGYTLLQSLANESKAQQDTLYALRICKLYNIKTLRVVTSYSSKVGENEYVINDANPLTLGSWFFGAGKYGKVKEHDGVVSVSSQMTGIKCDCISSSKTKRACVYYTCPHCGTIRVKVDHQAINFRNNCSIGKDMVVYNAWLQINDFIKGRT